MNDDEKCFCGGELYEDDDGRPGIWWCVSCADEIDLRTPAQRAEQIDD